MSLISILYRSVAKIPEASLEEAALLLDARAANRDHKITGYLYREGDIFAQYFEGEEPLVRRLYDNIRRDMRHKDVTLLVDRVIETLRYADWGMGFANLPTTGKAKIGGTTGDVLKFFGQSVGDPKPQPKNRVGLPLFASGGGKYPRLVRTTSKLPEG